MDITTTKASQISPLLNRTNGPPCKAYVVCNAGDPGLSIDAYCDIKSRFVLAIKSPSKRPFVPAGSDGAGIFLQDNLILVLRPQSLWITCPTNLNPTPTNTATINRVDYNGNVNIGSKNAYSQNNITPINNPYQIGETLTVQKFSDYISAEDQAFQSLFSMSNTNGEPYIVGNNNYRGQTMPATVDSNGLLIGGGKATGTTGGFSLSNNYFAVTLAQADYENFIASYYAGKGYVPSANIPPNLDYYFGTRPFVTFYCASYIDLNTNGKARTASSSCLPTIVAPPDSFLTPSERQTTNFYYTQI